MLTINCIIFDICDVDERVFFEDKIVCFCDNFKQILSVYSNKNRNFIVDTYFQKKSF